MKILSVLFFFLIMYPAQYFCQNINFSISVQDTLKSISPYIYGTNQLLKGGENWTAYRQGGNRYTGYNWENNASNAGMDYYNSSDNYLTYLAGINNPDSANIPGIVTSKFQDRSIALGAYSLVTLQMAGYVARDKNGTVDASQTAPSSRWIKVEDIKGSPFTLAPDTSDGYAYMDEYVNFLVNKYGMANTPTGIKGYSLDNEPSLWSSTHPRIHPDTTTCREIIQKSVSLAKAVKNIDPNAEIFGPALYGFNAYRVFQNAPDWSTVSRGKNYSWFIDYYLDQMKQASDSVGIRLLNVLDLHWYSEALGTNKITNPGANTFADDTARMHAPRTLWDSPHNYVENSWIGQWEKNYIPLIPKIINSINKYYPGTRLSFSEFNYGGEDDITGAIAIADVLGIFGKYGVYLATIWPLSTNSSYISAAYKIYRNYDGQNSCFGNYSVPAQTSDYANTSIYASENDPGNELHLIVINKRLSQSITGNFAFTVKKNIASGRVWELDSTNANIREIDSVKNITGNSFTYLLPAGSVCHFVLKLKDLPSSVISEVNASPENFYLKAYPNPFNPECKIEYNVPENSGSRIDIFSVTGELIRSFINLNRQGYIYWNGLNGNSGRVASGAYFVVLRNGDRIFSEQKLLLLK